MGSYFAALSAPYLVAMHNARRRAMLAAAAMRVISERNHAAVTQGVLFRVIQWS